MQIERYLCTKTKLTNQLCFQRLQALMRGTAQSKKQSYKACKIFIWPRLHNSIVSSRCAQETCTKAALFAAMLALAATPAPGDIVYPRCIDLDRAIYLATPTFYLPGQSFIHALTHTNAEKFTRRSHSCTRDA